MASFMGIWVSLYVYVSVHHFSNRLPLQNKPNMWVWYLLRPYQWKASPVVGSNHSIRDWIYSAHKSIRKQRSFTIAISANGHGVQKPGYGNFWLHWNVWMYLFCVRSDYLIKREVLNILFLELRLLDTMLQHRLPFYLWIIMFAIWYLFFLLW